MPHPLVDQLRFTRFEFRRGLRGLSKEDAVKRVQHANSISWAVGHLAWQEQRYWIWRMQGLDPILPELNDEFCYGCPPVTPDIDDVWRSWKKVTKAVDPYLDTLTTKDLLKERTTGRLTFTGGNLMQRVIYHYWYHLGESLGLRQALGHTGLPDFVGDIDTRAPYRYK